MHLFRRRERTDSGPSYAEEESNPELLAAEKAVNEMPSIPLAGGATGVILGHQPQFIGLPADRDSTETALDAQTAEDEGGATEQA